jgi:hypothetical protein
VSRDTAAGEDELARVAQGKRTKGQANENKDDANMDRTTVGDFQLADDDQLFVSDMTANFFLRQGPTSKEKNAALIPSPGPSHEHKVSLPLHVCGRARATEWHAVRAWRCFPHTSPSLPPPPPSPLALSLSTLQQVAIKQHDSLQKVATKTSDSLWSGLSSKASEQTLTSAGKYLKDYAWYAVPNHEQHPLTPGELPAWVLPPLNGNDATVYRQGHSCTGHDDFLHAFDHYDCSEQIDAQIRFLQLEPSQSADADYKNAMREHLLGLWAKHMSDSEEDCIPDSEPES